MIYSDKKKFWTTVKPLICNEIKLAENIGMLVNMRMVNWYKMKSKS